MGRADGRAAAGGAGPIPIVPVRRLGARPRERAAAQFGGVPVATLNSELGALAAGRIRRAAVAQCPDHRRCGSTTRCSSTPDADEYKLIERTLIQLDRPKLQVAIDVTIAEVTLNDQLNYGVQFFLAGGAVSNTVIGHDARASSTTSPRTAAPRPRGRACRAGSISSPATPRVPARRHQRAASANRRQDPFQSIARRRRQWRCDRSRWAIRFR